MVHSDDFKPLYTAVFISVANTALPTFCKMISQYESYVPFSFDSLNKDSYIIYFSHFLLFSFL